MLTAIYPSVNNQQGYSQAALLSAMRFPAPFRQLSLHFKVAEG
jgi:hypothetical protein